MRKLMLKMSISMDGFCADSDPNGPQNWLFSTADDESNAWELSFLKNAGSHAMGHNTYRVMAGTTGGAAHELGAFTGRRDWRIVGTPATGCRSTASTHPA
jgi:hypothetical protein